MGASASARRDGESPDDATAEEQNVEAIEVQEGEDVDAKALQKNGQISSLNGKAEDTAGEFNNQTEEKEPVDVGQTEPVPQKEDDPEMREALQEEVAPQVGSEKEEKETEADEMSSADKTAEEVKPEETSEVGFKKIFRFVGFKVTLKKDKNERDDPVQLLTVKKDEGEPSSSDVAEEPAVEESKVEPPTEDLKEEDVVKDTEKECTVEEPVETSAGRDTEPEAKEETPKTPPVEEQPAEKSADVVASGEATKATEQDAETEEPTLEAAAEKEIEVSTESPSSPTVQETQSSLKRFFTQGIFSNLRKKTSFKKAKEEELTKETAVKGEIKEDEETSESPDEEADKVTEEDGTQQKDSIATEDSKTEVIAEQVSDIVVEQKEDEIKVEIKVEADVSQVSAEEVTECSPAEGADNVSATTGKTEDDVEGNTSLEGAPAAATMEAELLSSQEKNKVQGSPLKKLLTGSGLKKLSYKKQKGKKEADAKLTESGEHASEQLQSSTESAEGQRGESSPSSTEESAEHAIGEPSQAESSPDHEAEGERKKDGILPWASFKKLVTPKKRTKKSSESDDDAAEKPKSATLSSTDSAVFAEKQEEPKPHEEEQKVEVVTEEPKKKIDTSVSWEALICVGSSKKRARKTSDSDDETPKIEEETQHSGAEQAKIAETQLGSSQEADHENLPSSPEQAGSPSEADGVSTWESLKRLVTPRRKPKVEDKVEETQTATASEQVPSDTEIPKEESSFSLKKLIPGRKKKKSDGKQEQVSSDEAGKSLGSGEEDSDTPAVVPLSEYDSEQVQMDETPSKKDTVAAIEKSAGTVEAEKTKPEVPVPESEELKSSDAGAQLKGVTDIEERLPSWIPATAVEDNQETTECISKQPLSDIPEEGDTIITPKSTAEEGSRDDTIADDIVELTSEAVTAVEQAPEVSLTEETTEMVSAVSRITESPRTSGDATPVQAEYDMEKTEAILQEAVQNITLTENVQSVMMTDLQQESVAVSVTPQVMESATKEETVVLVLHQKSEATAICTGLDSHDIESAEENTLQTSVESIIEVGEAMSTEMIVEDKIEKSEVAGVGEDHVFVAEVLDVNTESKEPGPVAELQQTPEQVEVKVEPVNEIQQNEVLLMGEVKSIPEAEHADLLQEQKAVNVASINLVQGESEELEEPIVAENTPKVETEGPLETAVEESICSQFVHVTEVSPLKADKVQEFEEVKKKVVDVEVTPLEEVMQCMVQEVTASIPEHPTAETAEIQEAPISVVAPAAEFLVSEETTSTISPLSELVSPKMAEIKGEVVMERVPSLQSTEGHEIHIEGTTTDIPVAEVVFEADTEAVCTSMTTTAEIVSEQAETTAVMQTDKIEVDAQEDSAVSELVIQNVDVVIQQEQEKKAETVEEDSTAIVEEHIEKVDREVTQILEAEIVKEAGKAEADVAIQSVDVEVMQTEQVEEAEAIKEDSTAVAEVVVQSLDAEALQAEKQVGAEIVEDNGKAEAEVVVQGDLEVGETEQVIEAEVKEDSTTASEMVVQSVEVEVLQAEEVEDMKEDSTAVAEVAAQNVEVVLKEEVKETEMIKEDSETVVEMTGQTVMEEAAKEECAEIVQDVPTGAMEAPQDATVLKMPRDDDTQVEMEASAEKVESEAVPPFAAQVEKEVKEKLEDSEVPEEPTVDKEEEKTILETVQVETHRSIQFGAIQSDVVLVDVPRKDISLEAPVENKQETEATVEEAEVKEEEQVEDEKVSLAIQEGVKEDRSESKELMSEQDTRPETKETKSDKDHNVAGEPQEGSRVTEMAMCQDVQVSESVQEEAKEAEEQVQPAAVALMTQTPSVVESESASDTEVDEAVRQDGVTNEETEPESKPEPADSNNVQIPIEGETKGDRQSQTTEQVKIQTTVTYSQGKVDVCEEQVKTTGDHSQTVQVTQTVREVEVTFEEKTVEVIKEPATSAAEAVVTHDSLPASSEQAESEVPQTPVEDLQSSDGDAASKELESGETGHREPLAEATKSQELPEKLCGPPQMEHKDGSGAAASAGSEAESDAKAQDELKDELPVTDDVSGSTALKTTEQAVLSEALEISGQVVLEAVNEPEAVSSELVAAS